MKNTSLVIFIAKWIIYLVLLVVLKELVVTVFDATADFCGSGFICSFLAALLALPTDIKLTIGERVE